MRLLKKIFPLLFLLPLQALAQLDVAKQNLQEIGVAAGYGSEERNLTVFIGNLIRIVLGFVGMIFLVLIIWAGIQWMMSGGNEQSIEQAKKRIINATIGLTVIILAYSIASFVVGSLEQAAGGGAGQSNFQVTP